MPTGAPRLRAAAKQDGCRASLLLLLLLPPPLGCPLLPHVAGAALQAGPRLGLPPPGVPPHLLLRACLLAARPAADQERLSEFDLKLMDIDSEHLGIPEAEYDATVSGPAV